MYPQTLKLRVDMEELDTWRRAAITAGLTLSEWVRRKCNGEATSTTFGDPIPKGATIVKTEKAVQSSYAPTTPKTPQDLVIEARRRKLANRYCVPHHVIGCEYCILHGEG